MLSGLVSGGRACGLSYNEIAKLLPCNPAQRFNLFDKENLAVGYDADCCLLDVAVGDEARSDESLWTQEYTLFEGFNLTANVTETYLRGQAVVEEERDGGGAHRQLLRRTGNK